jgi:DNA-binding transcriptional LysR family regulator
VLDVRRLSLLVELDRRGTIAAVAKALAYSPSAVSQQLSVLEKEAGATLLEPIGRRVQLTAEGKLLVVHAETVLAELEHARAALASSRGEVVGTVRLAAFQSAVLTLVPRALIRLQGEHPQLRVEVTEMEPESSLPDLQAGSFDLVLAEEYPGHPHSVLRGLDRQDLLDDRLVLAVPTTWPSSRLVSLAERPFVMEPIGTTSREWTTALCRSVGFEPDVRYTSTDLQVHLALVEHGLAAALLPSLSGAGTRAGVRTSAPPGKPSRRVFTSVRKGSRARPAIQAVVDALAAA